MPAMKRVLWVGGALVLVPVFALAALAVRASCVESFPDERKIWESADTRAAGLAVVPGEEFYPGEWRTVKMESDIQTGYLRFADGDVWRYGFASYHCVPGTNSFSVYKGANETWRLKGDRFCCEIFPGAEQPKNAEEFRAMLKKTGDVLEKVP
jgi:hypothetical protein